MRHPLLELHASDKDQCLARFKATMDGADTTGLPALVGTAVHRVAEAVTLELMEHAAADPREIAAAAFKRAVRDLDLPPAGVVDGLAILDRVLAFDSRIALRVEMGWSGRPEFRWAIDEEFKVVEPCAECVQGLIDPLPPTPCKACGGTGWSRPTLAAGTIDLIEWTSTRRKLRVTDWKTERGFRSADDAFEDWQARLYVYAALQHFPEAQTVEFRFGMLRHGYHARAEFVRGDPWQWSVEVRLRAMREQREQAVEENSWPETPGPWCEWCPIMHRCAALECLRASGAVPPDLEPDEMARRWKALQRLAGEYEAAVKARFEEDGHDEPIPLGDTRGTVLGFKPVQGWSLVHDYAETIERVRDLVPEGAWAQTFAENFRFVTEANFPARVRGVLRDLRVTEDVTDTIVIPVTKTQLTTFCPDPPAHGAPATLDEADELIDDIFGGG